MKAVLVAYLYYATFLPYVIYPPTFLFYPYHAKSLAFMHQLILMAVKILAI